MADRKRLLKIADELIEQYKDHPAVISIEVVGSVRRGKQTPGDLDFLICTNDKAAIKTKAPTEKKKLGPYDYRDVFFCTPETYGARKVFATGPRRFNRQLRILAIQHGFVFTTDSGLLRDGEIVPTIDEQALFDLIGAPWTPVEDRDAANLDVPQVGTELATLFREIGFESCNRCRSLAHRLDRMTPAQCRERESELVGQIKRNAESKGGKLTALQKIGIAKFYRLAIRRAEGTPDTLTDTALIAAAKVVG